MDEAVTKTIDADHFVPSNQLLGEAMKKFLVFFGLTFGSISFGSEFCDGFEEGYKIVKGNIVVVPVCPVAPVTPVGSTPFREGIKAGIRAARSR